MARQGEARQGGARRGGAGQGEGFGMTNESLFAIWRNMTRSHEFDEQVYRNVESGRIKSFVYLSSGQEAIAASVAEAFRGYKPNVFIQHRGHAAYISFGGNVLMLKNLILDSRGGDPMIREPSINLWGHSGLVADQAPQAVGFAYAAQSPVICFCGDATVEEDVFWPAVGFAVTHELPVLFVVEDNGLSVVTRTEKRRSWEILDVARAYGLETSGMIDEPESVYAAAKEFIDRPCPTLIEVQCCRKYRHVGIGKDGEMAWDMMDIVRQQVNKIDAARAERIESDARDLMETVWGL